MLDHNPSIMEDWKEQHFKWDYWGFRKLYIFSKSKNILLEDLCSLPLNQELYRSLNRVIFGDIVAVKVT